MSGTPPTGVWGVGACWGQPLALRSNCHLHLAPRHWRPLEGVPLSSLPIPAFVTAHGLDVCWMSNKNERLPRENPPMSDNGVSGTFLHCSVLVSSPYRTPSIILTAHNAVATKAHHASFPGVAYHPGGRSENPQDGLQTDLGHFLFFKEFPYPRESGLIIKVGPGMEGLSRNFSGE